MRIPNDLVLGTATAAYQIEGGVREGGRGPSIWDTFSHTPGTTHDGDTGDTACDHYHRHESDLDLLAWMGVDAYRFSIAWPRIQADGTGRGNVAGLDFYDRIVDGLLARGITPMVTLYHWDLPQALEDRGGWTARDTAGRFADYATIVGKRLGDRVHSWATLNEPWCSAVLGYHEGLHAPGLRDAQKAIRAGHHLLLAHGMGVQALRAEGCEGMGIVLNPTDVRAATEREGDQEAQRRVDGVKNRWWFDPILAGRYPEDLLASFQTIVETETWLQEGDTEQIAQPLDWIGVNYYFPETVAAGEARDGSDGREVVEAAAGPDLDGIVTADPPGERTSMGWPIDASGLTNLLQRMRADYDLPTVWITENGIAGHDRVDTRAASEERRVDDGYRIDFVRDHLRAFLDEAADGLDVGGYLVWSMLDNFEWARGYAQRFGIVHVDYGTQKRTPKRSAHWFRELVAERELA